VSHTRLSLMVPVVNIRGMCVNFERVVTRSGRRHDQGSAVMHPRRGRPPA